MDGITIGHPCCGEHDFKVPLALQHDCFCSVHQGMGYEHCCSITDCMQDIGGHHETCDIPEQQALETCGVESHMVMFQLHCRLKQLKIYHAPDMTTSFW